MDDCRRNGLAYTGSVVPSESKPPCISSMSSMRCCESALVQFSDTSRKEFTTTAACLPLMCTHSYVQRSGIMTVSEGSMTLRGVLADIELTSGCPSIRPLVSAARRMDGEDDACSVKYHDSTGGSRRGADRIFSHFRVTFSMYEDFVALRVMRIAVRKIMAVDDAYEQCRHTLRNPPVGLRRDYWVGTSLPQLVIARLIDRWICAVSRLATRPLTVVIVTRRLAASAWRPRLLPAFRRRLYHMVGSQVSLLALVTGRSLISRLAFTTQRMVASFLAAWWVPIFANKATLRIQRSGLTTADDDLETTHSGCICELWDDGASKGEDANVLSGVGKFVPAQGVVPN
jgi:hypothetical protein